MTFFPKSTRSNKQSPNRNNPKTKEQQDSQIKIVSSQTKKRLKTVANGSMIGSKKCHPTSKTTIKTTQRMKTNFMRRKKRKNQRNLRKMLNAADNQIVQNSIIERHKV